MSLQSCSSLPKHPKLSKPEGHGVGGGEMKTRGKGKGGKRNSPPAGVRNKEQDKEKSTIELEHVLGLTVYSNSALTCEPRSGLVAYPAGCVLVLLDSVKYKQVGTLHTPRKSITAAQFSPDGRFVLTGESGLQPAVRVWELHRMTEVGTLRGHSVGIASVSFSPSMREIIVVGDAQDMMISVWAWPGKQMRALNKFSDEICAMAVSDDSKFFVTVGNRHVKFYYMESLQTGLRHVDSSCPIPLPTRCGLLDNLKENCFCDIVCGRGHSKSFVFVVAVSGILCQINRNRLLERWVNVNMTSASCLTADDDNLFVGGTNGIIRMFRSLDLQIILTLPRPHSLGLDIAQVTSSYIEDTSEDETEAENKKFYSPHHPGTRALTYDPINKILTAVYDDHSIYIWYRDCQELEDSSAFQFRKRYSSMYHRGCVWDIDTYPAALESESEEGALGGAFPPGTLISVSADGTLRAWDVSAKICEESMLKRNCLSADCLKIIYNNEIEAIRRSREKLRQQCKPREGSAGSSSRHSKHSFSVVAVCPDGLHIATGNRHGRVCIYDTNSMKTVATMLAHEAEITALCYSITKRYKVLASGSRDRMIHVMDASRDYHLLTTLDDHSSTITAINFTYIARCLLMVTSSLDMSVLVRAYLDTSIFSFKPVRAIVEKKSVMDFTIHPWAGTMALACQDRLVRVYSVMSSMENNSFRGCPTYGGQLIKIQVDPSGQYLLTACSNKTINLLQFSTGLMMSTFNGHAESITCIKFSHNMKHVISSAVDGCIFLWRLPESVTYAVKREMAEMGRLTRGMVLSERWKKSRLLHGLQPFDVMSEPDFQVSQASCDCKASSSLDTTRKDPVSYHSKGKPERETETRTPGNTTCPQDTNLSPMYQETTHDRPEWFTAFSGTQSPKATVECDEDMGALKMWEQQKQLSPQRVSRLGGATSEAWLTACYERRRIFKLEAKSIKKILAMMKLVTDAMEKDLATTDWIMSPASDAASNTSLPIADPAHITQAVTSDSRKVEMILSASSTPRPTSNQKAESESSHPDLKKPDASFPVRQLCLGPQTSGSPDNFGAKAMKNIPMTQSASAKISHHPSPRSLPQRLHSTSFPSATPPCAGLSSSPVWAEQREGQQKYKKSEGNCSTNKKNSGDEELNLTMAMKDPPTDVKKLAQHQKTNIDLTNSLETFTIKVSAERNTYGCVGAFAFFNELGGLNYSSAVHCISEAMELKQKLQRSSSVPLFRSSLLQFSGGLGIHDNDVVNSKYVDTDEDNYNGIGIKKMKQDGFNGVPEEQTIVHTDASLRENVKATLENNQFKEEEFNPEFSDDDIFNSTETESYKYADLAIYSNKPLCDSVDGMSNKSSSPNSSVNIFTGDYCNEELYAEIEQDKEGLKNTGTVMSPVDDTKSQLDEDIRRVLTEYCDNGGCNFLVANESRKQDIGSRQDFFEGVGAYKQCDQEKCYHGTDNQDKCRVTTAETSQRVYNCAEGEVGANGIRDGSLKDAVNICDVEIKQERI